jgi:hypothetical protein
MSDIPASIRTAVALRADQRYEYCGLSQVGQEAIFHIDHVLPRAAGGPTTDDNLALARISCSLHKAARQSALDPDSNEETPLFNPRTQKWAEHFHWNGEIAIGLTPIGRATVTALKMNRPLIVAIRMEEAIRGRHPNP